MAHKPPTVAQHDYENLIAEGAPQLLGVEDAANIFHAQQDKAIATRNANETRKVCKKAAKTNREVIAALKRAHNNRRAE